MCERITEQRDEAAYGEDRHDEEAASAWREQQYERRSEDATISAMFESLMEDRE